MLKYVEKQIDDDEVIIFSTSCMCGCGSRLTMLYDKMDDSLCTIEMEVEYKSYDSYLKNLWWRIKNAFSILVKGSYMGYGSIYIRDHKQYEDFIEACEYAKNKLKDINN